jgi:hypothetical protein
MKFKNFFQSYKVISFNGRYVIFRKLFLILPIYLQYASEEYEVDLSLQREHEKKLNLRPKWKYIGHGIFNPEYFHVENSAYEYIISILLR